MSQDLDPLALQILDRRLRGVATGSVLHENRALGQLAVANGGQARLDVALGGQALVFPFGILLSRNENQPALEADANCSPNHVTRNVVASLADLRNQRLAALIPVKLLLQPHRSRRVVIGRNPMLVAEHDLAHANVRAVAFEEAASLEGSGAFEWRLRANKVFRHSSQVSRNR